MEDCSQGLMDVETVGGPVQDASAVREGGSGGHALRPNRASLRLILGSETRTSEKLA